MQAPQRRAIATAAAAGLLAVLAGAGVADASIPRPEASAELAAWPPALPDAPALIDVELAPASPATSATTTAPSAAAAAGDRRGLLDAATLDRLVWLGRPRRPHLFVEPETRVPAIELSSWEQRQGIPWFSCRIVACTPNERYEYSPYGERWIFVDLTPPVVEQVRSVGAELVLEISEEVSTAALSEAVADEDFALVETAGGSALGIEVTQPVDSGRQARRRLIVTTTDPPPAPGTEVRLAIAPAALTDFFFNRPAESFELTFPWPAADTILHDTTAPRLAQVLVRDGRLEVGLTEEPDLAAAAAAITVDGAAVAWTLSADRYTLLAGEELGPGSHQVAITTAALDLAGLGLAEAFSTSVTLASGTESRAVYEAPDPRQVSASTVSNQYGFKGLLHDPETGFIYMRHRYLDPELARFITVDPMGYQDSPSLYQYALNNPIQYGDPLGLAVEIQIGTYTFIVGDEMADYVKRRFGRVLGFGAEGYDQVRAMTDVGGDPLVIIPAFARQAGLELGRSFRIYNRLNAAYGKGGTEGFWSEYMAIRGELIDEYGAQLLEQPIGHTVHAFMQASEAEGAFERGMHEGRGALRFMEDLTLVFGVARVATAARAGAVTTGPITDPSRLLGRARQNLLQQAQNPSLRNAINELYRSNAQVGNGSAMDAYRFEQRTGQLLSPSGHGRKLIERRRQLQRLLREEGLAASDRQLVREILIDIQDALSSGGG